MKVTAQNVKVNVNCINKMYKTVQSSTVQYSTVLYSTIQCSTVQCRTVQYNTENIHHKVLHCNRCISLSHYRSLHCTALHIKITKIKCMLIFNNFDFHSIPQFFSNIYRDFHLHNNTLLFR